MIVILTDIHFTNNHIDTQLEFFEKQFFPYLLEHNIKDVLCAGDIFDLRIKVDISLLQTVRERFFLWFSKYDIRFHFIIGNHDAYHSSTISTNIAKAAGFNLLYNIFVYDTITTIDIDSYRIAMVPWLCGDKDVIFPEADIIVGHFETVSFPMVKGIECKSGYRISDFKNYKLCISGHYHLRNTKGNVTYIGNPFQKDWSDFKENKGFAVLDDNYNLTYVENCVSPKHLKIYYTEKSIMVDGE
jgi:DNA repair exonuclease SbcCD nuclease subunit